MAHQVPDKSQLLREWINSKLESHFDYSNKENRRSDFLNFLQSPDAKKYKMNEKNHRSLFYSILRSCCIDKGFDPATFGLKRSHSPRVVKDMDTQLTPKPKPGKKINQEEQLELTSEENKDDTQEENTEEIPQEEPLIDLETSKDVCNFAYEIIRMKYKHWTPLSDEQQTALGRAWLRLLQRYMVGKYMQFLIPLFVTFGILAQKSKEAGPAPKKEPEKPEDKNPENQQEVKEQKKREEKPDKTPTAGWLKKIGVDEKTLAGDKK